MSRLPVCMGGRGITAGLATLSFVPLIPCFLKQSTMSSNNIYIGTLNDHSQDHSKHVTVNVPAGTDVSSLVRSFFAEDVSPSEDSSNYSDCQSDITPVQEEKPADIIDSIIFTKKAKKECMIKTIIQAFKTALSSRRDKSRALAQEVQIWQDDEYLDAHYNAQVMYDEIAKIIPLPFGYEAFKQHYNHTRK